MLDPAWIDAYADEFDIFHVHFGFDAVSPDDLRGIVQTLRHHGKPLVYTAHDLRNPHHPDRRAHDAALDVLMPAADAILTLTRGAAQEIDERWGRTARVVPHPHVVALDRIDASRTRRARRRMQRPVVGVHLKSLRANMNALPMLKALLSEVPEHDAVLRIDVHNDVVTPDSSAYDAQVTDVLDDAAARRRVSVHRHDFFTDDELWSYIEGLDLSVLPYRFGTHSGWLEACYDLGTRVLAPRIGYYSDQHEGIHSYGLDGDGRPDLADLRAALRTLEDGAEPWQAESNARLRQRRGIALAHRDCYESALRSVSV